MPNQEMSLADIVQTVVRSGFDDDFCIYGNADEPLNEQASYLMAAYPEVRDGCDVYPQEAAGKGYGLVYYGGAFADVLILALEQKPDADIRELLQALNYYDRYGTFLDLTA